MHHGMYRRGQAAALQKFAGVNARELSALMGAIHPAAGGIAGLVTAPEGEGIPHGVATGVGSFGGQLVGERFGEGAGEALGLLLGKNPQLLASIGRSLGRSAGGFTGGYFGHGAAEEMMAPKKTASAASTALTVPFRQHAKMLPIGMQAAVGAMLGGYLGLGSSSHDPERSFTDDLKAGLIGTVLGGTLGGAVGLRRATRDPAYIAEFLHKLRGVEGYRNNAVLSRIVSGISEHGRDVVRSKGIDPNTLASIIHNQIYTIN